MEPSYSTASSLMTSRQESERVSPGLRENRGCAGCSSRLRAMRRPSLLSSTESMSPSYCSRSVFCTTMRMSDSFSRHSATREGICAKGSCSVTLTCAAAEAVHSSSPSSTVEERLRNMGAVHVALVEHTHHLHHRCGRALIPQEQRHGFPTSTAGRASAPDPCGTTRA
jgi:hypothetical protein